MTDNRTTELLNGLRSVGNLHEFAELFGFNWEDDSDWTWHDVAVKMADELEQAIAATLGWIDEPDTIRNELADGGLIADVLAPVCVDEKERTCECVAEYAKSPIDGKTIVLHRCSACHELMRPFMNYCPNCGARVIE